MRYAKHTLWIVLLLSISLPACKKPGPPATDTTPPSLALTAFNQGSNPTFNSSEGSNIEDPCALFPGLPASFLLSVGDQGGVRAVSIILPLGRFVRESINISPGAPESSWEISSYPDVGGGGEALIIRLTPPAPDMVRTGVFVLFEVDGIVPVPVRAEAIDYHDNHGSMPQIDARTSANLATCRGDSSSK